MISVQGVSQRFEDCLVLDGVNVEIPLGQTTFVLGSSGQGKTVFLKTLVGLLKPEQGRVLFNGSDIVAYDERELYRFWTSVGFVFQESALIDSLTVAENLSLYLTYQAKLKPREARARVRAGLASIGLDNIEDKYPEELSGGMKKRVAVARALAKDPAYLIFDEPTNGIDEQNAQVIKDLIVNLSREGKRTTLIATHDLRLMRDLANFVVFIKDRGIPFAGPKARVDDRSLKELYRAE